MSLARNSDQETRLEPLGFDEIVTDLSADIVEYFT